MNERLKFAVECVVADNEGRGASGNLVLERCLVARNRGGGVALLEGANVGLEQCLIARNTAHESGSSLGWGGGLLYLQGGLLTVTDSVFLENEADSGGGVAMSVTNRTSLLLENSWFLRNEAALLGGGAFLNLDSDSSFPATVRVRKCVFAHNRALAQHDQLSAGASATGGSTTIVEDCSFLGDGVGDSQTAIQAFTNHRRVDRSIVRGSPSAFLPGGFQVNRSNVEGGFAGTDNFDLDPLFVDPELGDLRLQAGSPCIDRVPGSRGADVEGDPQVGDIDVGADEFHRHLRAFGFPTEGETLTLTMVAPPSSSPTSLFFSTRRVLPPIVLPQGNYFLGPNSAPTLQLGAMGPEGFRQVVVPLVGDFAEPGVTYLQALLGAQLSNPIGVLVE